MEIEGIILQKHNVDVFIKHEVDPAKKKLDFIIFKRKRRPWEDPFSPAFIREE
jgi:hypothetical protein